MVRKLVILLAVTADLDKMPAPGSVIVVFGPKVKKGPGFQARAFAILP
jgi:kynurenine formamidase